MFVWKNLMLRCCISCLTAGLLLVNITGTLSAQESGRLANRFRAFDRDGDGRVTSDELTDAAMFKRLDRNADGAITLQETRQAVIAGILSDSSIPVPNSPTKSANEEGSADELMAIRQGPKQLKPGEVGVGRLIPDISFQDITSKTHRLSNFNDSRAIVIALTGNGCPLCLKYAPTLAQIEAAYAEKGVSFIYVNPKRIGSRRTDA